MRVKTLLQISIVSLAAMIWSVPASADAMKDFDVQKVDSWADALAICDTTRFLLSDPKLDSNVIISAMPNSSHIALYRPYFIPTSGFYSDAMKETFERVQKANFVTADSYNKARLRYARLMLQAYPYATSADQAFLADQMKTCYALAVDTSGKARNSTPVK
jgi:hypothetical protein